VPQRLPMLCSALINLKQHCLCVDQSLLQRDMSSTTTIGAISEVRCMAQRIKCKVATCIRYILCVWKWFLALAMLDKTNWNIRLLVN